MNASLPDYILNVSTKGQITIPKKIREKFRLDKNPYLMVYLENNKRNKFVPGGIILTPLARAHKKQK